jgi:hypothetical protein
LLRGFALGFEILNRAEAELDFVVNVVSDERHFLNDFLLVIELVERLLQLLIRFEEISLQFVLLRFGGGILPGSVAIVDDLIQEPDLLHKLAQGFQVVFTTFDLLVEDDTVESLFRGFGNELFG